MVSLRPREVAKALDVPGSTLENWFYRKICPAFSRFEHGQHRRFSWLDVLHAAAVREISLLGVPLDDAARIAAAGVENGPHIYFWRTPDQGWQGGAFVPPEVESYGCVKIPIISAKLQRHLGDRLPALALAEDAA